MRIHWKELRQYDEKAMEKTIAQCQTNETQRKLVRQ